MSYPYAEIALTVASAGGWRRATEREQARLLREAWSAGPNFLQHLPPWFDEAEGHPDPPWKGLEKKYAQGIPCVLTTAMLPSLHHMHNQLGSDFIAALGRNYRSAEALTVGDPRQHEARGPVVHRLPVAASTATGLKVLIDSFKYRISPYADDIPEAQWEKDKPVSVWHGRTEIALLEDWASHNEQALDEYVPGHGHLYYFLNVPKTALKAAEARLQRRRTVTGTQMTYEETLRRRGTDFDEQWAAHSCAIFIHDRHDWPVKLKDGRYLFDDRKAEVFVYDPSLNWRHINNEHDEDRTPHMSSFRNIHQAYSLLFDDTHSFGQATNPKAGWVRRPGRVRIGGGGNSVGACALMSCNWMQRTCYLYREVTRARHALQDDQNEETIANWKLAERAWKLYFMHWTDVQP